VYKRQHTSHGADPSIYIAERYVIGQVGFIQHAITQALTQELHELDPDLEESASKAWNMLMMVILEMLARAYREEHAPDPNERVLPVNPEVVHQLAVETYELGLGLNRPRAVYEVSAGPAAGIPDGERKIIQAGDLSIGVFHHRGSWVALHNHCQHRGGPVATGLLEGDTLTCPWHGYQYDVNTGGLLVDPSVKLESPNPGRANSLRPACHWERPLSSRLMASRLPFSTHKRVSSPLGRNAPMPAARSAKARSRMAR
jgi:nitrite reductase/ring-hydroxylating ferredoxin subunit